MARCSINFTNAQEMSLKGGEKQRKQVSLNWFKIYCFTTKITTILGTL